MSSAPVSPPGSPVRSALLYAQVIVLTGVVIFFAFDLKRANLHIPFYYSVGGGDLLFFLTEYKTIAQTGWYTENPWLGAPATFSLYDFPTSDTGLWLGAKLLIATLGDPFVASNVYFLLTFFTAAIASLYVLRCFGGDGQVAVATSLLFAFLPFHFWRGPFHPAYSTYHYIPLIVMVAVWLCGGEPLVCGRDEAGRLRWAGSWQRTLPVAIACVLASVSGVYYAFFAVFFILTGGVIGVLRKPGVDRVLDMIAAASLITGLFAAQLIPNARYAAREGPNPTASKRMLGSYYQYSLRVVNLLRPTAGHRIPWLEQTLPPERTKPPADLTWLTNETNEAEVDTPLGTLGALGFLTVIAIGLAAPCAISRRKPVVGDLGQLTIAALLLALVGGFSEVGAIYITTKIRCYNRISIFIAFFSLAALALLATRDKLETEPGQGHGVVRTRWTWLFAVWLVTGLGLLDQIPPLFVPDHARDAAAFRSDQEFITRIEKAIPARSMIFQLPPNSFPEFGRHFSMYDYSHFRGYLHSRELRWSFGAMRGREAEKLHTRLAPLPPSDLVDSLVAAGFSGIYVDRKGHEANAKMVVEGLLRKVPQTPIANRDGSLLFFRLPAAIHAH